MVNTPSNRAKTTRPFSAACARCTRVQTVRASSPRAAAGKLISHGWNTIDDRLVCPECVKERQYLRTSMRCDHCGRLETVEQPPRGAVGEFHRRGWVGNSCPECVKTEKTAP